MASSTWSCDRWGPVHDDELCRWDAIPDDALEEEQEEARGGAGWGAGAPTPRPTRAAKLLALRRRLQDVIPLTYVVHRLLPGQGISIGVPGRAHGLPPLARAGSVPPALQPSAVAVGKRNEQQLVVCCGGLAPAEAMALSRGMARGDLDAAARAGPRDREDAPDVSRAFAVEAARPSASTTVLAPTCGGGVAAVPAPPADALPHGSHGHSLAARGRLVVMFGGHAPPGAASAAPSARQLMLDPAAARQDAAHGLTSVLQLLSLDGGGAGGGGGASCLSERRWLDADAQTGSVPCPRAMHSAAFARPPPPAPSARRAAAAWAAPSHSSVLLPPEVLSGAEDFWFDDGGALIAVREMRKKRELMQQEQQEQQEQQGPWSASLLGSDDAEWQGATEGGGEGSGGALAPGEAVRAATALDCALAHEQQLKWAAREHPFPYMYVFGGVRYEGGGGGCGIGGTAGGGNPLDARMRVPADKEAGTLHAMLLTPAREPGGRPRAKWQRLETAAAPGQPARAVPNTTTLLAFWASPDGGALYAVPDRLPGRGAGGGGGRYALHRLCLRDLEWRLVAVLDGCGGGGGGGAGTAAGAACAGPEPRVGAAAVFLPPTVEEAPYSGGRLVVYGGRRVGGGNGGNGGGGGRSRAPPTPPSPATTTADVHVLHLPPDGALAAEGSLARRAHEAALAGVLPPPTQAGRLAARRLRERGRDGAAAATTAWWEPVFPQRWDLAPPTPTPGSSSSAARNTASGGAGGGRRAAPSAPEEPAMLPLWQHAGAAWFAADGGGGGGSGERGDREAEAASEDEEEVGAEGAAAAVFVGGADASGPLGPPSLAVQVLRLSVALPPGAPPAGGSALQRARQHVRRAIAVLLLRARRRRPGRQARRRVALRCAAGAGVDAAAASADLELLALYSDLFDEQLQGLVGAEQDEGDSEEEQQAGGGDASAAPPQILPVPVESPDALLNLLCWAQGRLSLWALAPRELQELYVAADALAMPRLMAEAREELDAGTLGRRRRPRRAD